MKVVEPTVENIRPGLFTLRPCYETVFQHVARCGSRDRATIIFSWPTTRRGVSVSPRNRFITVAVSRVRFACDKSLRLAERNMHHRKSILSGHICFGPVSQVRCISRAGPFRWRSMWSVAVDGATGERGPRIKPSAVLHLLKSSKVVFREIPFVLREEWRFHAFASAIDREYGTKLSMVPAGGSGPTGAGGVLVVCSRCIPIAQSCREFDGYSFRLRGYCTAERFIGSRAGAESRCTRTCLQIPAAGLLYRVCAPPNSRRGSRNWAPPHAARSPATGTRRLGTRECADCRRNRLFDTAIS